MAKSTYPHDPRDPRLKRCVRCGHRRMPDSICSKHARTCVTCCSRLGLPCGIRAATEAIREVSTRLGALGDSAESAAKATDAYTAAQVQADIDALYGKEEDR